MTRTPPRSTLFPTRRSSDLPVRPDADVEELFAALGGPLPQTGLDPQAVLASLVEDASPDRKSTRLNSSHTVISYAVFCLKKKKNEINSTNAEYNRTKSKSSS